MLYLEMYILCTPSRHEVAHGCVRVCVWQAIDDGDASGQARETLHPCATLVPPQCRPERGGTRLLVVNSIYFPQQTYV